jgi:hypothetical protein
VREALLVKHTICVTNLDRRLATLAAPASSASDLLCWLFRGEMIKALTSGLDARHPPGEGIAATERAAREAELQAKRLGLERVEEALIEAALAANLDVHRRYDALPLALLGIGFASVAAVPQAAE